MDPDEIGLEDAIGAALDEQGGAGDAPPVEQKQAAVEDPFPKADDLPKKDAPKEYVREGRRFVLKDGKETEVVADKDAATDVTAAAKQWKPTWYKDEYGPWDKLAEPFRNALREQERSFAKGIADHSAAAKAWEPVNKLIEPHLAELKAAGVEPQTYVSNLINADKYLRESPVDALNWLCQSYLKTDIIGLANWMDENGKEPAKIDPVKQELDALKQRLSNYEAQGQNAQRAALEAQIQDWAKDKPHFDDVRELMASLARASQNKGASLDQLYEAALMAHPQLRQRILEDKRRAEVQRARDGSLNTRGADVANGHARQSPKMSLEDEIGMLLDGGTV